MSHDMKKTVVIVDDTPENLRLLAQILSEQGYRVRSAPNGERAIATIQKERPDLILLDIVMPEMDGFEVCRWLKEDERFKDIPIIFISALNEVFDKVAAFSIGAVDYITKPFQIEEVLARVHTHLSLVEMRETFQAQNQQLHDQNRELEAFAHTVAHDLKSPLAVLVGSLELLRSDADPADDQALKILGLSTNAAHKMNSIIDELLLLASIRKEEVQTAPIEMGSVVEQAFTRLSHMVNRYQPEVIAPNTWPIAHGYAPWVEEVWVNYLSNGLKYGGQPPILELGAVQQPDGICFYVKDNGKGLDPDGQLRLFTEFTRLDKIRAQGHGLGLSIVRRIMDKLGGNFGVESTPGQGSFFYFTLPLN
ncbi:MAG: hybrid sensor histidine kinase/response regulator [Burkholderiales bacterium]|nr:hybrid sensor histidine kinase/response regulator [Anaerolineae bacterium]